MTLFEYVHKLNKEQFARFLVMMLASATQDKNILEDKRVRDALVIGAEHALDMDVAPEVVKNVEA